MKKLYKKLMFTLVVVCLFSVTNLSAQNLLLNPDFETGELAPWVAGNMNIVDIVNDAQNGDWAARGNIEQFVNLTEGVTYTYTAYAKCLSGCDVNMWIGLRDSLKAFPAKNFNFKDFSDYTLATIEFDAEATASYRMWVWGQGESDSYITDNFVLLAEGTTVTSTKEIETNKIKITNQLDGITVNIDSFAGSANIEIFDLAGKPVYNLKTSDATTFISSEEFSASGIYVVQVASNKQLMAKQVSIVK